MRVRRARTAKLASEGETFSQGSPSGDWQSELRSRQFNVHWTRRTIGKRAWRFSRPSAGNLVGTGRSESTRIASSELVCPAPPCYKYCY